jgi:BCD family chlorophyll transporter-like MFS transporter
MNAPALGWFGIFRLGLVQTALGAIVVLITSTINRVMVVELALPAMLPGILVGWHYAIQIMRPRWGFGSDRSARRTPWIIAGMAILALGGIAAALATALLSIQPVLGVLAGFIAFTIVGVGVGAAGTSLLALLASRVAPHRRAPAATIVWIMMIAGFAVTAGVAGKLLDPFSLTRLVTVTAGVSLAAVLLAIVAVAGVEGRPTPAPLASGEAPAPAPAVSFRAAIAREWADPEARRFAIFIFVSMLAYSAQDLILEPFAGAVFAMTPGETTSLSGLQHGGVMMGMILVALAGAGLLGSYMRSLRLWSILGCMVSAAALFGLSLAGFWSGRWPLEANVAVLGLGNGAFAVAAIGSMMGLASTGREKREGVRMGMWGAAQAVAFGLGGFLGTAAADIARHLLGSPLEAYAAVFAAEAALFLASGVMAAGILAPRLAATPPAAIAATPVRR